MGLGPTMQQGAIDVQKHEHPDSVAGGGRVAPPPAWGQAPGTAGIGAIGRWASSDSAPTTSMNRSG